jgi:hypothetical protein
MTAMSILAMAMVICLFGGTGRKNRPNIRKFCRETIAPF